MNTIPTGASVEGTRTPTAQTFRILNLGAGVQSTALYLMSLRGDEPLHVPPYDYAIFADTQEEPDEVYRHLAWLESLGGPPILRRTFGKLGDDLIHGHHQVRRNDGAKYRPGEMVGQMYHVPAFVKHADDTRRSGIVSRKCTQAYKINVIDRAIREDVVGLKSRQRFTSGVTVTQHFGLSFDEPTRVAKTRAIARNGWFNPVFPLFDLEWTRGDCIDYLKAIVPHEVPRSACTFCPYHSNAEWRRLRDHDPKGWERACEIDEGIRRPDAACAQDLDGTLYLHRSCVPLRQAPIDIGPAKEPEGVRQECTGMCGL